MATVNVEVGSPKVISTSTLVKSGTAQLLGIFCSSANTSSKVAISDKLTSGASAAAGRIVAPFKVASGNFYRLPVGVGTGLFVSCLGSTGSLSLTVVYQPTT